MQTRDGRKKDDSGNPLTKKGDIFSNIEGGYVQWQTIQLADIKNTKKLFPDYKALNSQVLQDVVNRVETSFSNFTTPDQNGNRRGKPKFKGFHYYKSFTYPQLDNLDREPLSIAGIASIKYRKSCRKDGIPVSAEHLWIEMKIQRNLLEKLV
ncbi:hypothetical protein [Microcoleus anatoxicus]|uniref:Uncharacterized protein n=1 Tax=Microcoleus anatoxicus PTRS2 TaxID=2705321 RepID=A0ABU8YPH4_9CYAN